MWKAKKENCYNCKKQRHFVKECHSKKRQALKIYIRVIKEKKLHSYNVIFWTICYNDDCTIHWSDKDSSE